MPPFTIRYTLTRRQRLGELFPWLPAVAGSLGFSFGVAYLACYVSAWCLVLLALPVVFYRGLVALTFELIFRPGKPVEIAVDEETIRVSIGNVSRGLPLDGIIQVFRKEGRDEWTVLHMEGTAITLPAHSITPAQLDFLKGFALRSARERWAAGPGE
ncbi:MAG TPA: hypothetical protein VLM40_09710 [Gemmata sp.]|nr:hypothetical protein [Gemmata sp.]